MSSSGQVNLRMTCGFNAKGTRHLRSAGGEDRKGQGAPDQSRQEVLHRQGDRVTVKIKVSKSGRSIVKSRKGLRVEAVLRVRRDAANAAMRINSKKLTLRAARK